MYNKKMIVRTAQVSDLPEIINLTKMLLQIHQKIDPQYYDYEENYSANLANWAEQQINSQNQFLLVALYENQSNKISGFISGYIKYLFPWFKIKSVGHISFLSVH